MSEQDELMRAMAKALQKQEEEPDFKITLTQSQLNNIVRGNIKRMQNQRHMEDHNQKLTLFGFGLIGMIVYLFLL